MTKNISIRFLFAAMLCIVCNVGFTFAQGGTGGITGVVSDSNGAAVPSASVTATNKATNQTLTTAASGDGIYRFVTLSPGIYTVKASSGSFAEQAQDVEVQVGRTTDANFALGAAGVSADVTVTAEGIQTTQANSDAVLNDTAISNLPIFGRRFQDFTQLTPSAQVEGSRGQISLSGQRGINGNVNIDGTDFNQPFFGGIRGGERSNQAFVIPQESIKEFQVVAAGYNAEFGRSTGGIINAVTKSGSNDYRGSAFYLIRPDKLARNTEFTRNLQVQRLDGLGVTASLAPTQHQFGGSFGGPIFKDNLFFFGSYEQQRFRAPRFVLISGIAGVTLPAGDRGLEALNYLSSLEEQFGQTNDAYAALGRLDWTPNDNNRINVRLSYSRNDAMNAAATGETALDPSTNNALSSNGFEKNRSKIFVGQWVSNITPTTINDLRVQVAREDRPRDSNSFIPNVFFGANFGQYGARNFLPTTQFDTRQQLIENLSYIKGNHIFKFGGEFSRIFAEQQFGFNQFGAYTLSTGGANAILRNISLPGPPVPVAPASYAGRFDDINARYARQIGNLQADFVTHELSFYAQDAWRISPKLTINYGLRVEQQFNPDSDASNTNLVNVVQNTNFPFRNGGFDPTQIPDSGWQWGPRLGFAYDPKGDGKMVFRGYGGMYYARTPGLIFADSVNNYRTTPGNVSTTLPFTGFNQGTFNTFLATPAGATYRAITGCVPGGTPTQVALCTPNTVYRQFAIAGVNLNAFPLDGLPNVTPAQIATIAGGLGLSTNPFVGAQITGHDENFKNPNSYQFGFSAEKEIANGFVIGADYSFVRTIHLQRNRDLNNPSPLSATQYVSFLQANNSAGAFNALVANGIIGQILAGGRTYIAIVTPGGMPTSVIVNNVNTTVVSTRQRPTNDPLLNPNPANRLALGAVQIRESSAKALYQGFTLRTRLVRKWGQLNAYYTLSRSLTDDDNERDSGGVAFANPYDLTGEYAPSRLDRKHQFVASPVFFLPWDFTVSSSIRLRSGTPLSTYIGTDANGDNIFNDRPLVNPGEELTRNYFRNRNLIDVDLRIQKSFKFGETRALILSSEFFNLLNRTNILFQFPGTNSTSGTLLQYCSSGTQLCGLNGITNPNFMETRLTGGPFAGQLNVANVNPGSQVFQMQLGARFQF